MRGVPHTVLIDPAGNVVKFNLRGEELVSTVKDILSKPFKPAKSNAKAATDASAVKMAPFKASSAADQKLYDEYETLCKRKDLSKIAKLRSRPQHFARGSVHT